MSNVTITDIEVDELIEAVRYAADQARCRINLGSVYDLKSPETQNAMVLFDKFTHLLSELKAKRSGE